jgi:hypothetical protein
MEERRNFPSIRNPLGKTSVAQSLDGWPSNGEPAYSPGSKPIPTCSDGQGAPVGDVGAHLSHCRRGGIQIRADQVAPGAPGSERQRAIEIATLISQQAPLAIAATLAMRGKPYSKGRTSPRLNCKRSRAGCRPRKTRRKASAVSSRNDRPNSWVADVWRGVRNAGAAQTRSCWACRRCWGRNLRHTAARRLPPAARIAPSATRVEFPPGRFREPGHQNVPLEPSSPPSAANRRAVASSIPLLPPLIRAVFP